MNIRRIEKKKKKAREERTNYHQKYSQKMLVNQKKFVTKFNAKKLAHVKHVIAYME